MKFINWKCAAERCDPRKRHASSFPSGMTKSLLQRQCLGSCMCHVACCIRHVTCGWLVCKRWKLYYCIITFDSGYVRDESKDSVVVLDSSCFLAWVLSPCHSLGTMPIRNSRNDMCNMHLPFPFAACWLLENHLKIIKLMLSYPIERQAPTSHALICIVANDFVERFLKNVFILGLTSPWSSRFGV